MFVGLPQQDSPDESLSKESLSDVSIICRKSYQREFMYVNINTTTL